MILVSGGTGFVGSYLIKLLVDKGYKVRAIKRKNSRLDMLGNYADKVEWVEGSILDVGFLDEALKGIEKVYHSAAVITFLEKEVPNMFKVNIEGTANIVNASLDHKVKKFLHVSSISAFGRSENSQVMIDEETEWREGKYNTNYAISKYNAEREVWRGQEEGLNTVIINPATILGACYWNFGTGSIFTKLSDGLKFYTVGMNGFVDVRDVVEIAYQLMESEVSNERFVLCSENIYFKDLFIKISKGIGRTPPKIKANPFINEFAWRMEKLKYWLTGIKPIITPETARMASFRYQYNNAKISKILGYKFIPLDKTIDDTCKAFVSSKREGKDFAMF